MTTRRVLALTILACTGILAPAAAAVLSPASPPSLGGALELNTGGATTAPVEPTSLQSSRAADLPPLAVAGTASGPATVPTAPSVEPGDDSAPTPRTTPVPAPPAQVVDDNGGDRDRDDRTEPGDDRDDRDRDDRDESDDDRDDD